MMAMAARRMGFRVVVLDPSTDCPTGAGRRRRGRGPARRPSARAIEPRRAGRRGHPRHRARAGRPSLDEDRGGDAGPARGRRAAHDPGPPHPEEFLDRIGLPQARWAPADDAAGLAAAVAEFGGDGVLKARRDGYDGKGQVRMGRGVDPAAALARIRGVDARGRGGSCRSSREISVVLARSTGRRRPHLPDRRERPPPPHPRTPPARPRRCPTPCASRPRRSGSASPTRSTTSASWRSSCSSCPAAGCWSTRSRRAPTTAATTPTAPAPPRSSSSTSRAVCGLPLGDPARD